MAELARRTGALDGDVRAGPLKPLGSAVRIPGVTMKAAIVAAVVLVFAGTASAAPPRAQLDLAAGHGNSRVVVVRLTKAGKPVTGAIVVASATMALPGHSMSLAPARLKHRGGGVYKARVNFVMLGRWTVKVVARAGALGTGRASRTFTVGP